MWGWAKTVWYVLTLRCEEADRVRSVHRDGGAGRAGVVGERLHSILCGNCRRARRTLRELDSLIGELREGDDRAPAGRMPPEARERVLGVIAGRRETGG